MDTPDTPTFRQEASPASSFAARGAAQAQYAEAAAFLCEALVAEVARLILDAYPTARVAECHAEWNEDGQPTLHLRTLRDEDGTDLYEAEAVFEAERATAGRELQTADGRWDALTDEVDPELSYLAELSGDDYLRGVVLELQPQEDQ